MGGRQQKTDDARRPRKDDVVRTVKLRTIEVSDEVYERLEEIVERSKRNYPGYGHLRQSPDELAEAYLREKIRHYDEMRRIESLPFVPLHGR